MSAISQLQTNENIRIVFMGSSVLAIELVNGILASPDVATIVGILPVSNLARFRFLRQHPSEIALLKLAAKHDVKLLDANSVNSVEFVNDLRELKPRVLLVGGWSEIIKSPVLQLKDLAIINCHGSLLPQYRGAHPYLAAIFNGDKVTGFTFHLIDEGVDTGDILFQQELKVQEKEMTLGLTQRIAAKFGEAIVPLIQELKAGKILPRKQTGETSYVSTLNPEWGWIPWEMAPDVIDQRLRALKGILPLATSIDNIVIGFATGKVVKLDHGFSGVSSLSPLSHRSRTEPGVVVESGPEKFLVSTRDPKYVVELNKPVIVPDWQETPEIREGAQFCSIACEGI